MLQTGSGVMCVGAFWRVVVLGFLCCSILVHLQSVSLGNQHQVYVSLLFMGGQMLALKTQTVDFATAFWGFVTVQMARFNNVPRAFVALLCLPFGSSSFVAVSMYSSSGVTGFFIA